MPGLRASLNEVALQVALKSRPVLQDGRRHDLPTLKHEIGNCFYWCTRGKRHPRVTRSRSHSQLRFLVGPTDEAAMWFVLRMTFWLGVVLVFLPTGGAQTVPKSQVSVSEALSAAKGTVTDIEHFCERQQEACVVGSRTAVTLGQRAQAGAKMLYEFLSKRLGSDQHNAVQTRPSQYTLRPTDVASPWRGPPPPAKMPHSRSTKRDDSLS